MNRCGQLWTQSYSRTGTASLSTLSWQLLNLARASFWVNIRIKTWVLSLSISFIVQHPWLLDMLCPTFLFRHEWLAEYFLRQPCSSLKKMCMPHVWKWHKSCLPKDVLSARCQKMIDNCFQNVAKDIHWEKNHLLSVLRHMCVIRLHSCNNLTPHIILNRLGFKQV